MNNKGFISVGIVLIVVLLIGIFGFFSLYNGLKEAEIRVDASYGQVENQMQRRSDLIPNLVNTVKFHGDPAHDLLGVGGNWFHRRIGLLG